MSHELAIYAAAPEERWRYAQALADASLLPEAYRRQPSNVLLALESGSALNVAPMVAIQEIHVIKGKPSPSAQLMAALVRRAGHRLRITGDATHARCEIVRADDPEFTFVSEWTMQRAQAAGLTTEMWKKYPANMLKARAISECCRDACPDVVVGFGYTPEEMGDETDTAGAEVIVERGDTQTDTGSATQAESPSASGGAGSIPADASDPVSDNGIEDAVVVDETTGEVGGGEAPASPASRYTGPTDPALTRRYGKPHEKAGNAARTRLIVEMERAGIPKDDRDANLAWCSERVGRELESRSDLTAAEVGYLIDVLRPGAT